MNGDEKNKERELREELVTHAEESSVEEHVVFDFSGTEQANVEDLSLILTARLMSAPTDSVWCRSIPLRTARILEYLRLDHLFRQYPEGEGPLN
ncbi:MAG: hypothetical protein AAF389_16925 [Gemmatimonadota bacterium]